MKRLIVGLTGTYGSGKSTVGKLFKRLGTAKVIDADKLVHEAFRPGSSILKKIKVLFQMKKAVTRQAVAEVVFKDAMKRRLLERIVHPYVFQRIDSEVKKVKKGIVVLEIPLLFETQADRFCDKTVAVVAGTKNILNRLRTKGVRPIQAMARIKAHWTEAKKAKCADFIIHNQRSKKDLVRQTQCVFERMKSILRKR